MLTPKKPEKCPKEGEVLVFENGTVLGSVQLESDTKRGYSVISDEQLSLIDRCDISGNSANVSSGGCSLNSSFLSSQQNTSNALIDSCSFSQASEQIPESVCGSEFSQAEILSTSTCSRDSRQSKRARRKLKKCGGQAEVYMNRYPPQYTAIYLEGTSGGVVQASTLNQMAPLDSSHVAVPVRTTTTQNPRTFYSRCFSKPSLPFVIGILALGGVACTLGGIVLGSTGLVEHSTQYLSAALLMIGIGVSLLVIAGAIWKLSIPDEAEACPCFRHMETCRNCNSPFCNNRLLPGRYVYPEFQHRPPPPSYLTSLNECTYGFIIQEPSNSQREAMRISTPPPSYRSYSSNSVSVFPSVQHLPETQSFTNPIASTSTTIEETEPIYVEIDTSKEPEFKPS